MSLLGRVKGWLAGPPPAAEEQVGERERRAGNEALQAGRLEEAVEHYRGFVAARPEHAPAHLNLGFALTRLQRETEAVAELRRACELDSASHEARFFLARVLLAQSELAAAEPLLAEAVRLQPEFVPGWLELGVVRERRRAWGSARQAFERAAELEPASVAAWQGVARVALKQDDAAIALEAADKALSLAPQSALSLGMRGEALAQLRRCDEALQMVDAALALEPGARLPQLVRAGAFQRVDRLTEAEAAYRDVLTRFPDDPQALSGLGAVLVGLDRPAEALAVLERAAVAEPDDPVVLNNHALALMHLLRFGDAIEALEAATERLPDDRRLRFLLASARLEIGDMTAGWRDYEARAQAQVAGPARWQPGEAVDGRTVLLLSEQGLGDAIQFVRYVPEVLKRGARVVLQVSPRVKPLVDGLWAGCEVITDVGAAGHVDRYCPLLSLPHVLAEPKPLAVAVPYIRSATDRVGHWRERIGSGPEPAVGLVWSGNPSHPDDRRRSLALELMRVAAPSSGVRFVSLQYEVRDSDRAAFAAWPGLLHVGTEQRDLADTAALIQVLDAVLCVDTSVAHATAALGRPLFLLLQYCPDWRWGVSGDGSAWYPTARLLRQGEDRRWEPVLARAMALLLQLPRRAELN